MKTLQIKNLVFPIAYSLLVIIGTCIAFYGGYSNHINKISIIGWLLIVPFCVLAMIYAKNSIYNNNIGGKEAIKEGLTFIILSSLILVLFQAVFFTMDFKAYKVEFINTYGLELAKVQITSGNLKITEAEIPGLLAKEIEQVTLFKECTSIVFKNLFLGIITTVITAVTMRAKVF